MSDFERGSQVARKRSQRGVIFEQPSGENPALTRNRVEVPSLTRRRMAGNNRKREALTVVSRKLLSRELLCKWPEDTAICRKDLSKYFMLELRAPGQSGAETHCAESAVFFSRSRRPIRGKL